MGFQKIPCHVHNFSAIGGVAASLGLFIQEILLTKTTMVHVDSATDAGENRERLGQDGPERRGVRVLHVASWFPSELHGSLGNFIARHVAAISTATGPSAVIVAIPVPKHRLGGIPPRLEPPVSLEGAALGVEVHRAYVPAKRPGVILMTRALKQLAHRWVASTGERPDIVHLHVTYPAGAAARQLADRYGVPLVVTEHWTALGPTLPPPVATPTPNAGASRLPLWVRLSVRRTLRRAAMACPVSGDLGRGLAGFGLKQSQTIPNVVDTDRFHLPDAPRRPMLLHVSSMLDRQKNVSEMLSAFARVRGELPADATFVLVGQNDLPRHAQTIAQLGLADHVVLRGGLEATEVAAVMRTAAAFVLFSRFENFPCVLPEAWASGLPVIAPDVGGIAEALQTRPDRGILVPAGDGAALERAMVDAFKTPWDRTAMRAFAEAHYSIPAIASAYADVYKQCLRR